MNRTTIRRADASKNKRVMAVPLRMLRMSTFSMLLLIILAASTRSSSAYDASPPNYAWKQQSWYAPSLAPTPAPEKERELHKKHKKRGRKMRTVPRGSKTAQPETRGRSSNVQQKKKIKRHKKVDIVRKYSTATATATVQNRPKTTRQQSESPQRHGSVIHTDIPPSRRHSSKDRVAGISPKRKLKKIKRKKLASTVDTATATTQVKRDNIPAPTATISHHQNVVTKKRTKKKRRKLTDGSALVGENKQQSTSNVTSAFGDDQSIATAAPEFAAAVPSDKITLHAFVTKNTSQSVPSDNITLPAVLTKNTTQRSSMRLLSVDGPAVGNETSTRVVELESEAISSNTESGQVLGSDIAPAAADSADADDTSSAQTVVQGIHLDKTDTSSVVLAESGPNTVDQKREGVDESQLESDPRVPGDQISIEAVLPDDEDIANVCDAPNSETITVNGTAALSESDNVSRMDELESTSHNASLLENAEHVSNETDSTVADAAASSRSDDRNEMMKKLSFLITPVVSTDGTSPVLQSNGSVPLDPEESLPNNQKAVESESTALQKVNQEEDDSGPVADAEMHRDRADQSFGIITEQSFLSADNVLASNVPGMSDDRTKRNSNGSSTEDGTDTNTTTTSHQDVNKASDSIPPSESTEIGSTEVETVRIHLPKIDNSEEPVVDGGQIDLESSLNGIYEKNDLIVSVVTWNLAEESPAEADAAFIRQFRGKGDQGSDLVLISGQECENIKPRRNEGSRSREYRRLMVKMLGRDYVPLALHLLGGIQFGLFCKRSILANIEQASIADVTCGIGNVFHNKGAIGCFVRMKAKENPSEDESSVKRAKSVRMLFVTAHLAAHVKNTDARDSDFWRIASELEAQAPPRFLPPKQFQENTTGGSYLLETVDRIFFCGDLNYRIDLPREKVEMAVHQMQTILGSSDHQAQQKLERIRDELLRYDQLRESIALERAFPGFSEGKISFHPTFKFDKQTGDYDTSHKQRIPAWTDRVLFKPSGTSVLEYTSVPSSQHSDHRPVFATFRVSMLGKPLIKRRRKVQKPADD